MQDQLESHGYVVDYAADGARALTMAASGAYQVLLLDVNMPVYDGVEVVRRLHEQSPATPVKVIVVTADRFATRHAELSRRGIDGYMTKPVDFDRLNNEISRLLALDHA